MVGKVIISYVKLSIASRSNIKFRKKMHIAFWSVHFRMKTFIMSWREMKMNPYILKSSGEGSQLNGRKGAID